MRYTVLAAAFLAACLLPAQQNVSQTEKPSGESAVVRFFRDGASNIEYLCTALGSNDQAEWTRNASTSKQPRPEPGLSGIATLTSVTVAAGVGTWTVSEAHGLYPGAWFYMQGATVDPDLNNGPLTHNNRNYYKVATVPTPTTFTAAAQNVSDAAYTESTLKMVSSAPRLNALVWAIRKLYYTGSAIDGDVPSLGQGAMDKSCNLRVTYF